MTTTTDITDYKYEYNEIMNGNRKLSGKHHVRELFDFKFDKLDLAEIDALKNNCVNLGVVLVVRHAIPNKVFYPNHPIEMHLEDYEHKSYKEEMKRLYADISYLLWCSLSELHRRRVFYAELHKGWPVYLKRQLPAPEEEEEKVERPVLPVVENPPPVVVNTEVTTKQPPTKRTQLSKTQKKKKMDSESDSSSDSE